MAGTDRTKENRIEPGPAIILVRPQLGANIGMSARAMLNCGLSELRIVAPRDGWPNPEAISAAAGAHEVVEEAAFFDSVEAAIADLQQVYATTARNHDQAKPVYHPRAAAEEQRAAIAEGLKVGILFGAERTGLESDEVALADRVVTAPLNPAYSSLNLAQGVLLCAWEYRTAAGVEGIVFDRGKSERAEKRLLIEMFERMERLLTERRFFNPPEKAPSMKRNLRNIFQRADLSEQEVNSLQGVFSALIGKKMKLDDASLPEDEETR